MAWRATTTRSDAVFTKISRLTGRCPRRSPRSFNTAQKKALEKEKRDLEKEAQKRIAEEKALTQRRK